MTRPAPYLFRYPRSRNWYFRIQIPKELREPGEPAEIRKSLGTHDRRLAEMRAADEIQAHRKRLWTSTNRRNGWFVMRDLGTWMYPLGHTVLEDGTIQIATEELCYWINPKTGETEKFFNVQEAEIFDDFDPENPPSQIIATVTRERLNPPQPPRFKAALKTDSGEDRKIIDFWIERNKISAHLKRETYDAYEIFCKICGGKSFRNCKRSDGLKLVAHYEALNLSGPTIRKKVGHLRAAINFAVKKGFVEEFDLNPFAGVSPDKERDNPLRRLNFDAADMALVRSNLHSFNPDERLLWVLLATTGMRRSEAWDITEERVEDGLRGCTIGKRPRSAYERFHFLMQHYLFCQQKLLAACFRIVIQYADRSTSANACCGESANSVSSTNAKCCTACVIEPSRGCAP